MTRRCEFYISVVCFVSRVCTPHAQCRFLFGNSYCCSLDLSCSRSEVGVDRLLQEPILAVLGVSAGHGTDFTTLGMPGGEDRNPPQDGDDGRESDRGDREESCLAVAQVDSARGRSGGRAARNLIGDDTRLLDDVAAVPSSTTIEKGKYHQLKQFASGRGRAPPGGRLVVNFRDDPGWDHSRLFLWPVDANTWMVLTPDGDKCAEKFSDYSRVRVPLIVEGETPETGSVEFSRGWPLDELSELVREGRNLALNARSSMGLMYDRDPTMMRDLSGRLFNAPPVTLGERVWRRIVRKLPMWRSAPVNPLALSRDLGGHGDTSLGRSVPRPPTPRVQLDRAMSVSDNVWVSMEIGRIYQLKFASVVVLPGDALVRRARGLMPLPGGGYVAVQRIRSGDLATFVEKAVDGMLPSPGEFPGIRDETFPVSRNESGDKTNLRDRLSIRPPSDEEHLGSREPPDDLRTLWIEYDAHGDRHKAWRDFIREAPFEVYKDWPFDDGRSALLCMVKHFERHGDDGLNWLACWLRQNEIYEHERTLIEMRCLITCRHLSGTYDQLNSLCLASMETVARRIAQIVEAYSGDGGKPRWARVRHYEGRTSAMDCIDPTFRFAVAKKTCEELDLENHRGTFRGVTGAGNRGDTSPGAGEGVDGEGTFAPKGGGRQKRRARGVAAATQ